VAADGNSAAHGILYRLVGGTIAAIAFNHHWFSGPPEWPPTRLVFLFAVSDGCFATAKTHERNDMGDDTYTDEHLIAAMLANGLLSNSAKETTTRSQGKSPGAPKGNKNALKHGRYTAEAISQRREISLLIRTARQSIEEF
jgi:hypothetical protein